MDEDAMWKGLYEKLQEMKKNPPTEHDSKIQDLDGGFFEKFGSLLRQKSELHEEGLSAPLAPLPHHEDADSDAVATATTLNTIEEGENDSGTDTLQDTDSETEEQNQSKQEEFIGSLVGWNIEELYEEILYEIIHNVGCEGDNETCKNALFDYVQDAFKIVNERHDEIFKAAEMKEPPEIRLNVEVIEAKELQPKDPNGMSDPFVTMYIASTPTHRYNTSVKTSTLNPTWEEHFSLPVNENPNDENLVVEVWDFDPAETVSEKMTKFFDVKGVKGFKKLMKEIAVTASTGKHDNELIGRCNIPLRTIPSSGLIMWFSLDKKNKLKRQGLIKIRLTFSAEKNNKVAAQEHRHLLRILLMHELDTSKVAPFWWSGKFSVQGESIISQHSAQSSLTPIDCAFIQWSVYTVIHSDHPLAFTLFENILDKLLRQLQSFNPDQDDIKLFWDGARKLLPSCFSVIRKLRKKTTTDKNNMKVLHEVLSILSKISMLEPPEGTDLFPRSIYGWITKEGDEPNCDIQGALKDAVYSGAEDWFVHINESGDIQNGTDEDKLQHIIRIIQLVRSDLQRTIEYYDKLFQEKMRFHYARSCYAYYEEKLSEFIEPVIQQVCRNLKRLSLPDDNHLHELPEHEEVNMGTTLFELYLVLKRFVVLGNALFSPGETNFKINQYHQWFTKGVTHWLDISVYKALTRIEKAIELDQLIPVDDTVKYSSSAVDTLAIFYQIKIFWQQLDWPDIEGSYMFVSKIVDDICRCCVFYADQMSKRVEGLGDVQNMYEKRFEVTREWCLAINNIDYIRQSLPPFVRELRIDEIIGKLAEYRSQIEAERCSETVKNVIANAIDTETNKILALIEIVARKMSPPMRKFLIEGAELLHQDSNSMDRLMMYLEDSLKTLNSELNEINFERILDAIWIELSVILYELVQSNLDKRRPPSFFSNLRDTLQIMVTSFKSTHSDPSKIQSDRETLEHIERLLQLHGYETSALIHQYYLERMKEQATVTDSKYGQLTVRCKFINNNLEIEIMNARNLVPMDTNGLCDSFVRLHFIPEEKFSGVTKPKTSTQNKTLFPLYDEKFLIQLSPEQRAIENAVILFSVKDKDLFGMSNQYIAECYLGFNAIPTSDNYTDEQVHLSLSRPIYIDTDCVRALEYRQGDKQAKEFIKKLKQKIGPG